MTDFGPKNSEDRDHMCTPSLSSGDLGHVCSCIYPPPSYTREAGTIWQIGIHDSRYVARLLSQEILVILGHSVFDVSSQSSLEFKFCASVGYWYVMGSAKGVFWV